MSPPRADEENTIHQGRMERELEDEERRRKEEKKDRSKERRYSP